MSALHPKATVCCAAAKRRFVPLATNVQRGENLADSIISMEIAVKSP
jgi:hypothetical protein